MSRFSKKRPTSENARHARRAYQNKTHVSLSGTVMALSVAFLFLPLAVIVFYSFNKAKAWFGRVSPLLVREAFPRFGKTLDVVRQQPHYRFHHRLCVSTFSARIAAIGLTGTTL
jgi:ABC-type spermidine/putrescine transport system permease subunit II